METGDSDQIREQPGYARGHPGLRIFDLVGPTTRQSAFRFLNSRTVAVTPGSHSQFVESAKLLKASNAAAFKEMGITFAGKPPASPQLDAFASELTRIRLPLEPRPVMGRFWTDFHIPEVGTFDGISFWLSHADLVSVPGVETSAVKLLRPKNPVYVESIDQVLPELIKSGRQWQVTSRVAPHLPERDILKLLHRATSSPHALSRKDWEIVSEFKHQAHEWMKLEEAWWRWNRRFYDTIALHRTRLAVRNWTIT